MRTVHALLVSVALSAAGCSSERWGSDEEVLLVTYDVPAEADLAAVSSAVKDETSVRIGLDKSALAPLLGQWEGLAAAQGGRPLTVEWVEVDPNAAPRRSAGAASPPNPPAPTLRWGSLVRVVDGELPLQPRGRLIALQARIAVLTPNSQCLAGAHLARLAQWSVVSRFVRTLEAVALAKGLAFELVYRGDVPAHLLPGRIGAPPLKVRAR